MADGQTTFSKLNGSASSSENTSEEASDMEDEPNVLKMSESVTVGELAFTAYLSEESS